MQFSKFYIRTLIILMIPISSSAQDLRVGGNVGFFLSEINPMDAFDIAATIDFIPHKSILYLETGPQLTITPNSTIFTAPLYLGFIIGSTATIEPGFGATCVQMLTMVMFWESAPDIIYRKRIKYI